MARESQLSEVEANITPESKRRELEDQGHVTLIARLVAAISRPRRRVIYAAKSSNCFNTVSEILNNKASCRLLYPSAPNSALIAACGLGDCQKARVLPDSVANVKAFDEYGQSVLISSLTELNHRNDWSVFSIMDFLLELGAGANFDNRDRVYFQHSNAKPALARYIEAYDRYLIG